MYMHGVIVSTVNDRLFKACVCVSVPQEKLVLEQQMSQLTAEVRQREAALEAYEHRLSNVTAALARLEGTLRQEQDEKVRITIKQNLRRT